MERKCSITELYPQLLQCLSFYYKPKIIKKKTSNTLQNQSRNSARDLILFGCLHLSPRDTAKTCAPWNHSRSKYQLL